jgi:hypothetical protein
MTRCRPLLRWVPRDGSPPSSLLSRHSDSRPSPLRSAWRSTRRLPSCDGGRSGLPSSWTALAYVPCSKTPAGRAPMPVSGGPPYSRALRCCLPLVQKTSATACFNLSRLDHTARTLAVYASRRRSPFATQDSLPAGDIPWPDRTVRSGPAMGSYGTFLPFSFPFPQALLGAHDLFVSPLHRVYLAGHRAGASTSARPRSVPWRMQSGIPIPSYPPPAM